MSDHMSVNSNQSPVDRNSGPTADSQNAALLQAFIKQMKALGKFGTGNLFSGTSAKQKDDSNQDSQVKEAIKSDIIQHETGSSITEESQFDSMVSDWVKSFSSAPPDASKPGMPPPIFTSVPPKGPSGVNNPWAQLPYASILLSIIMKCMNLDAYSQFVSGQKQADMTKAQGEVQRFIAQTKIDIGKKEQQEYNTQAGFALAQGCAGLALAGYSIYGAQKSSNRAFDDKTKQLMDNPKANTENYMKTRQQVAEANTKLQTKRAELNKLEDSAKKPETLENSQRDLNKLKEQQGLDQQKLKGMNEDVNNLNGKSRIAERELNDVKAKDQKLDKEIEDTKDAQVRAQQEVNVKEKQLKEVQNRVPPAPTAEREKAESERNAANVNKADIDKKLADLNAKKVNLQVSIKEKQDNFNDAKKELTEARAERDKLDQDLKKTQNAIDEKTKEVDLLKEAARLEGNGTDAIKLKKKEISSEESRLKSLNSKLEKMPEPGINQLREYTTNTKSSSPDESKRVDDAKKLLEYKESEYKSRTTDPSFAQGEKDNTFRQHTMAMDAFNRAANSVLEAAKDFAVGNIKLDKATLESQYSLMEALAKLYDTGGESFRNDIQTAGKNLDGWASFAQQILQSETDRFGFKR